jgi:hypothetical protein
MMKPGIEQWIVRDYQKPANVAQFAGVAWVFCL